MQTLLYIATIGASLLGTGLFIALIWEFVRWRRSHRSLSLSESSERFMATSRLYGPMMIALGTFLALRTLEEVTAGFTHWPPASELGTRFVPILLFFAAVISGGMVWARRSAHLRKTGEPLSDEREVAIGLKANRIVVSVLVLFTLVRAAVDFMQAGNAKSVMLFVATNPWSQTFLVVLLTMGLAQSYYRKQMS